MTARYEMIIDGETLSENSLDATVIDFSAIIINTDKMISDNPYTARDIVNVQYFKLDIDEQQTDFDTKISPKTLEFWKSQSAETRQRLKPLPDDLKVSDFVDKFTLYYNTEPSIKRVWCRNPAFDLILLKRMFLYANKDIEDVIPFYIYRDMRTAIDTSFGFDNSIDNNFCPIKDEVFWNKIYKPHNSTWDVIADVLRYQAILRINNELEMVNR